MTGDPIGHHLTIVCELRGLLRAMRLDVHALETAVDKLSVLRDPPIIRAGFHDCHDAADAVREGVRIICKTIENALKEKAS